MGRDYTMFWLGWLVLATLTAARLDYYGFDASVEQMRAGWLSTWSAGNLLMYTAHLGAIAVLWLTRGER